MRKGRPREFKWLIHDYITSYQMGIIKPAIVWIVTISIHAFINIYFSTTTSSHVACQVLIIKSWMKTGMVMASWNLLRAIWWDWVKDETLWWSMELIGWQSNCTFLGIVLLTEPMLKPIVSSRLFWYPGNSEGDHLFLFPAFIKEVRDELHRRGFCCSAASFALALAEIWKLASLSPFSVLRSIAL